MMQVQATATFHRQVMRLRASQKADLDWAICKILLDTSIGVPKKGDLAGVRVFKFRFIGQPALLAYECSPFRRSLVLLSVSSSEYFTTI